MKNPTKRYRTQHSLEQMSPTEPVYSHREDDTLERQATTCLININQQDQDQPFISKRQQVTDCQLSEWQLDSKIVGDKSCQIKQKRKRGRGLQSYSKDKLSIMEKSLINNNYNLSLDRARNNYTEIVQIQSKSINQKPKRQRIKNDKEEISQKMSSFKVQIKREPKHSLFVRCIQLSQRYRPRRKVKEVGPCIERVVQSQRQQQAGRGGRQNTRHCLPLLRSRSKTKYEAFSRLTRRETGPVQQRLSPDLKKYIGRITRLLRGQSTRLAELS